MPRLDPVLKQTGESLTADQRAQAVDVLYDGFERKLLRLLILTRSEAQAKRLLPKLIDFSQCVVAMLGADVIGIMFLNRGSKRCIEFDWRLGFAEFGVLGTLARRVNYWLVYEKRRPPSNLNIQALAVAPEYRSQGVGAALIGAAKAAAQSEGFRELTLEVVDTNPRAKRLYASLGFVTRRTSWTEPFTRRAGFRSVDTMCLPIEASSTPVCAQPKGRSLTASLPACPTHHATSRCD